MSRGRILQTGMTTQQCGSATRFKYDPVAKLFADAMRHYGYTVDHRPAVPDEDLTAYDAVFVGLGPLNGFSARHTYGGLDMIARAQASGTALIYYIDDWQTQLIGSSSRTMIRDPRRLSKDKVAGNSIRNNGPWIHADSEHLDRLIGACDMLANQEWPATVMALYDGGDWNLFRDKVPTQNLVGVDGTPFYQDYDIVPRPDSERYGAWVFGILSDQRKWIDSLHITWPMAHRGGKASKADEGMPEAELVQMYADCWGVLSCPYWHAGSGWLRIRHHHAAQTGAILVSESPELTFISDAYGVKAHDVEQLTRPQLRELANAQRDAWFGRLPSRDDVATRIGELMDKEIAGMK